MSDDRKRKELSSSPEINQEKEKLLRNTATPPEHHVSVQLLDAAEQVTTPTKSPSSLDLLSKCKLFEVNTSPKAKRKLDCEFLYECIIGLELRVFKQEAEVSALKLELEKKDQRIAHLNEEVITDLKDRLHVLETAPPPPVSLSDEIISDLDARVQMLENPAPPAIFPAHEAVSVYSSEDVNFITHMKREVPKLSDDCAKNANDISDLKIKVSSPMLNGGDSEEQLSRMKEQMKNMRRKMHLEKDHSEQYSRREILRVTGVPQKPDEDTTQIMCQIAHSIGIQISPSDISVSHRNGKSLGSNPRPILVKFVRREVKNQILQRKKFTRNITHDPDGNAVKIFLDEALTSMRASVCKKLRTDRVDHYTRDGKVFLKTGENSYTVLDFPEDWVELDWSDKFKTDLGIYPKEQ